MTPKEILMQYPELFELRSIPAWIFRYVEQFLFRLLYGLANGMETLINKLAELLNFFNHPEVEGFYRIFVLASFVFLAIALMLQGYNFIIGKRKTVSDLFRNTVLGVLFIVAIPWTMNQFLEIANASVSALGTDEEGNILLAENVLYDNITDIEVLAESGEWGNLEARKNVSKELPFEALDLTEPADGDEEVLGVKLVSNGESVTDEDLDNEGLLSFWKEYYFRYSYDFLVIMLEFLALIVIYIFFAFKIISVAFELATTKLVAPFAINTDIGTGQKLKVVVKELINGFATFVSIFYLLRLYQLFTSWVLGMELFAVPILNAIVMMVVAFVVIDGTKTIPRIFGFDAGVKDGQATLMGMYAASRLGMTFGRGAKGLANGVGESLNHNADKMGKWNENRKEAGGVGNQLQNKGNEWMENLRHPVQAAQGALQSSHLAHSFAQGGFQQGLVNELAMETGATVGNSEKALQRTGNDPAKARTYLQNMGMTSPLEGEEAPEASLSESHIGESGVTEAKASEGVGGTGGKDLNEVLGQRESGVAAPGTGVSLKGKEKNRPGRAGVASLASFNPEGVDEGFTEENNVPLPSLDNSPFRGAKTRSESVEASPEGSYTLERNIEPRASQQGISAQAVSHVAEGGAGGLVRINGDGTVNIPRMEEILLEEAVPPVSVQGPAPSSRGSHSRVESMEVGSGDSPTFHRTVEARGSHREVNTDVVAQVRPGTERIRTRINTDGTLNVPRMEELLEEGSKNPSRTLPASQKRNPRKESKKAGDGQKER